MRILINAVNIKVGGGVTVLLNLLNELVSNKKYKVYEFLVLVPSLERYTDFNKIPVKIEAVPKIVTFPYFRVFTDFFWLKKRVEKYCPSAVFTIGNFPIQTSFKQAVLFMYPYAIYPREREVWSRLTRIDFIDLKLRNFVFENRLKYADLILPQTITSKNRLLMYYGSKIKSIIVVPTAFSRIGVDKNVNFNFSKDGDTKYFLCLTRYYRHKNVEVLIALGNIIKFTGSSYRIVTTISRDQGDSACKFLDDILLNGLENIIVNVGQVAYDAVPSLYKQCDALLLPTLLESFSATYIDSMSFGKPIFTSDRDFSREVCGDAAFYFDPHDAHDIFNCMNDAFSSEENIHYKVNYGFARINEMPDWNEVASDYISILDRLVKK
jgi:glycosyltransferase involved in cell wall biosynthesis